MSRVPMMSPATTTTQNTITVMSTSNINLAAAERDVSFLLSFFSGGGTHDKAALTTSSNCITPRPDTASQPTEVL